MLALNSHYDFNGVDTVKVYSIPVVPMTDYTRSGLARYGSPDDLQRNVQTLKVTKDRAFTFIIDRGDKLQSQMASDAGRALQRQLREVWVPEYDAYVFRTLAASATAHGNYSTEAITKANAYEAFLKGMEALGNANVPDEGRVAFCSYGFVAGRHRRGRRLPHRQGAVQPSARGRGLPDRASARGHRPQAARGLQDPR